MFLYFSPAHSENKTEHKRDPSSTTNSDSDKKNNTKKRNRSSETKSKRTTHTVNNTISFENASPVVSSQTSTHIQIQTRTDDDQIRIQQMLDGKHPRILDSVKKHKHEPYLVFKLPSLQLSYLHSFCDALKDDFSTVTFIFTKNGIHVREVKTANMAVFSEFTKFEASEYVMHPSEHIFVLSVQTATFAAIIKQVNEGKKDVAMVYFFIQGTDPDYFRIFWVNVAKDNDTVVYVRTVNNPNYQEMVLSDFEYGCTVWISVKRLSEILKAVRGINSAMCTSPDDIFAFWVVNGTIKFGVQATCGQAIAWSTLNPSSETSENDQNMTLISNDTESNVVNFKCYYKIKQWQNVLKLSPAVNYVELCIPKQNGLRYNGKRVHLSIVFDIKSLGTVRFFLAGQMVDDMSEIEDCDTLDKMGNEDENEDENEDNEKK